MRTPRLRYRSLTATVSCAAISLVVACNGDTGGQDRNSEDDAGGAGGAGPSGGTTSVGGSSAGQGGNAGTAGATGATGATASGGSDPTGGSGAAPAACPCPVESYCNLATNSCVTGCTSDEHCAAERLCNVGTRECFDGCHLDADCSGGRICREAGCVVPCGSDAQCPAGQVCEELGCRPGCRDASSCGAGQTCDLRILRCTGRPCGSDAECDPTTLCNPATGKCEYGCQLNGTTLGTSTDRCLPGQTCMQANCNGVSCFYCDQRCTSPFATECKDGEAADYVCTSFNDQLCARACSETIDCGSGEVCVAVSANRRCVPACSSDTQCAAARPVGSGPVGAGCFCRQDGICHDANEQECEYRDWPAR